MIEAMLFLVLICVAGLTTTITDMRYGKIYNLHLLIFLLLAFALFFFFVQNKTPVFFYNTILSVLLSLLLGFFLWFFGVWTAGDGKLFTLFSFINTIGGVTGAPAPLSFFHLLVNTFTPLFLFFSIILIFKTTIKKKVFYLRRAFSFLRIINTFLIFLGSSLFLWYIVKNYPAFWLPALGFMLLFYFIVYKLPKFSSYILVFATAILCIFFRPSLVLVSSVILLSLFYIFVRYFLFYLGEDYFTKELQIGDLRPGDLPVKAKEFIFSNKKIPPEGITNAQLNRTLKLKKNTKVNVKQTIPFAPFLFIGSLLCYVTKGNIIIYLLNLFFK